jgi:ADP-ribosylglycohydrolase
MSDTNCSSIAVSTGKRCLKRATKDGKCNQHAMKDMKDAEDDVKIQLTPSVHALPQGYNVDKVKGMFMLLSLGDALGVPYEFFRIEPKIEHSKKLNETPFVIHFRFADTHVPGGSVSDDTEMTCALLKALRCNDYKYDSEIVLLNYMEWANRSKMLGKNTRKLFKGVRTINGYKNRYDKIESIEKESMQSNGCIMRCAPLIFVNEGDVIMDVNLSNPNATSIFSVTLFVQLLRMCVLKHKNKVELREYCIEYINTEGTPEDVRTAVVDSLSEVKRDISGKTKGWVCNTLYIALYSFWKYEKFSDAMDYIIRENPNSDCDTNACVAGALFGAYYGYEKITSEEYTKENLEKLMLYNPVVLDMWNMYQ